MVKHIGTNQIETERLTLRRFKPKDEFSMFLNYVNNPAVTKFVTWNTHKDISETKALVERWVNMYNDEVYRWAICRKNSKSVIGSIDVVNEKFDFHSVEVGYVLAPEFWGKGYMTEVLCAVQDYLFELGIHRIEGRHHVENIGSGRVMQKSGMQKECIKKGAGIKNNKQFDLACWAIINNNEVVE